MRRNKIVSLGLNQLVDELISKEYSPSQIRDYLVSQGYDLTLSTIKNYFKFRGIAAKKTKRTINDKFDADYVVEFPVINTVKLLNELEIPDILDSPENAALALQRAHIQITFDLWAVFYVYLQLLKQDKIKIFPVELAKTYLMAVRECKEILGIDELIKETSALKTLKQLGYDINDETR